MEKGNGPHPLAVLGAVATWLTIMLALHAQTSVALSDLRSEVRDTRISVEHRLTKVEVKLDSLGAATSERRSERGRLSVASR